MILTILILLCVCNIAYNIFFIVKNKGIPNSFSYTSYLLQRWGYDYRWFMGFCIVSGLIMMPLWLSLSSEGTQFLAFLSCSGLIFVGTTPLYRESYQKTIHWVAGVICVLSAMLWLVFNTMWVEIRIIVLLFLMSLVLDYKNYTYWIEEITLFMILATLIGLCV